MNIKPIPDALLGDSFVLHVPTEYGWAETVIGNVRVERTSAVTDPSAASPRENTTLTIWYDYVNSYPGANFAAGMRAEYGGELFELTEVKFYRAETLHHCRITAKKLGGSAEVSF